MLVESTKITNENIPEWNQEIIIEAINIVEDVYELSCFFPVAPCEKCDFLLRVRNKLKEIERKNSEVESA